MHVRILNMICRLLKRYFYFFTFLPFYSFQLPFTSLLFYIFTLSNCLFTFLLFYPFTLSPVFLPLYFFTLFPAFLPFYFFTSLPFKQNWTGREDAPTGPCYPKNSN